MVNDLMPSAMALDASGEPLASSGDDQAVTHILEQVAWANSVQRSITVQYRGPDQPMQIIQNGKRLLLAGRNWIYVWAVVRDFDYYFDAIEPPIIDGMPTADFSKPAWHVVKGTGRRYFFTSFAEGWGESDLYLKYLKPRWGEMVLDLGAYCGLSALTFSKAVGPFGRVVSVEADPDNYRSLQVNLKAARRKNIQAIHKAVSATSESLWFSCEGNMGSMVIDEPSHSRDRAVEVMGITLDGIVRETGLKKVDIVKMDIEGAEYEALEASLNFIERHKSRWMIEVHGEGGGRPENYSRIRTIFERFGYSTIQIPRGDSWYPLICAKPW